VLKPLKFTIKRFKGCNSSSSFSNITKIILVFKLILNYYKERVDVYANVN
jgi:hypothetical protein